MKNLMLAVTLFVGAGALVSAQGQKAEDFPEDKYDFKSVPAQRSFAEQLLHASGVNYYFTNVVLGEKPPASENPPRDQFKSKAAIVEYVKKSFANGAVGIYRRRATMA